MRLLLINYTMDRNSPVLAWQQKLAGLLSSRVEKLVVLTSEVGAFDAADNMIVERLPKKPFGVSRYIGGGLLLNPKIYCLIKKHKIDACFIHMAHDWAYELAPAFKLAGIPVLLWYAHGSVTWRLKLAHECVDHVVTSTSDGFRLPSHKLSIIGQGIDSDLYGLPAQAPATRNEMIYVGRISARKRIDRLIDVMAALYKLQPETGWKLHLVGPALTEDDIDYLQKMQALAEEKSVQEAILFHGAWPADQIPAFYEKAFLHLNLSETGSMDKTVMEALSAGCPVLTSNIAFKNLLHAMPHYFAEAGLSADDVAARIIELQRNPVSPDSCRALVVGKHDLPHYTGQIINILTQLALK